MSCCTGVCGCNQGTGGSAVANFSDILNPLLNDGKFMVQVFAENALASMYGSMFFDQVEVYNDKGQGFIQYKFKNPVNMQKVKVNSDCTVSWLESVICGASTTVAVAAIIGATTITVTDISALKGITKNGGILISSGGKIIRAMVLSVAGNVITLVAPLTSAILIDSCVFRSAANWGSSCTVVPVNATTLSGMKEYKTNMRSLYLSYDFDTCNNDLDRMYGGFEGYVKQIQMASEAQFLNEFVDTFFHDRNGSFQNADGDTYTETMGLLPAIDLAADGGLPVRFDYSTCCVVGDCAADQKIIKAFLTRIAKHVKTGFYKGKEVNVAFNEQGISDFHDLYQGFLEYTGIVNMGARNEVELEIPHLEVLKFQGINIRFYYEKALDKIPGSFHVVFPTDGFFVWQAEYKGVGSSGSDLKVINQINGQIKAGIPTLRYVDLTDTHTNRMGRCQKIVGFMDYYIAIP